METYDAIMAFDALSQPTRLKVFRLLVREGPAGRNAGELADALGIAASTLSFHLKELEQAGLVAASREGRNVRYMADYAGIRDVITFLMADCCNGDPRLCGPYVVSPKTANQECC